MTPSNSFLERSRSLASRYVTLLSHLDYPDQQLTAEQVEWAFQQPGISGDFIAWLVENVSVEESALARSELPRTLPSPSDASSAEYGHSTTSSTGLISAKELQQQIRSHQQHISMLERHSSLLTTHLSSTEQTIADQQSYLAELDALEQAANLRLNQAYEDAKVGLDIDMDQALASIADKVTGLVQLLDDPAYLGLFAHNTAHNEKVDTGYDEHLTLLRQLCKQLITQAGVVSGTNDPALPSLLKSHGVNNVPSLLQKANVMATGHVNTFSAEDLLSLQIAIDHLKAAQAEMYAECIEVVLKEVANLLAIVIIQHQSCQLELDQMQDVGSLLQQVTDTINERIGSAQESRNAMDAKNEIIRDSRRLMDSKLLTVEHGGDVSSSLNAAEAIIDDLRQSLTQKQQLTQESNLDTMTAEIESLANQVEQLARINFNPQIDDKCTELKSSATNLRSMISDATTLSKIDSFMKSKLESL
ncbi:hypothetical protein GQ42DRAFT_178478 [Ramicandelaber brevisporus]|nr:hypothetical protein GQ42DRAFT_178478 [Ramicandelaber brevisporus]